MELKPELNEKLMEFYCYLLDKKPELNLNEEKNRFLYDEINKEHSVGLDEMIWNLGLNLPSWDDDLPNGDN